MLLVKHYINLAVNKLRIFIYFGGCRYILKVLFDNEESSGIVYVWIGSKADPDEARLIVEIAEEMFNNVSINSSGGTCCTNVHQICSCVLLEQSDGIVLEETAYV
jgi:hypothetical protein